ncbi:hypothetical protein C6989_05125 [Nitrosopumilus sp. b2]|nr:hypothetical protein C6989_05125 [Nitrosopumilus sp. b2]
MIFVTGLVPFASAAQLDASILYEDQVVEPSFEFLRIIYIEYPEGGEIAQQLRGDMDTISFDAEGDDTIKLVTLLNENLESIPSNAKVTDAKLKYQATLHGNPSSAVIEYKLQIVPTITNHIFHQEDQKSTIDANWRGILIEGPAIIQTQYGEFDINNPRSALELMIPDISEKLQGVEILEIPLIDAGGIKELPLSRWHSLFDNTAILPGAIEYKYTGKNVITHYSMGECTIIIGVCNDREWMEEVDLDKQYTIRIIESRDDAVIAIEGYVDSTYVGELEVFHTSLKKLGENEAFREDQFLVVALYGMAMLGVIGAVAMFVLSNKKLKRDKTQGQTGIDPAHLRSYETSGSSGSYKTNRGESYLITDGKSKMPL